MLILLGDGSRHVLSSSVFTAGSGSVNNLVVPGDQVRKIHFQIVREGERYRLIGLNGTVDVNGRAVSEHWLEPGDAITLGGARWDVVADTPRVDLPTSQGPNPYEVLLEGVIALLENPDKRRSAEDVLSLGVRLMEADGGFLFACEEGGVSLLHCIPEDNVLFSNSAVQSVLRSGKTLIWSMSEDSGGVSLRSVEQKNIHSLLVSPLRESASGNVHGILYVHRRRSAAPFQESQRALFDRVSQVLGAVLSDSQGQLSRQRQLESLGAREGDTLLFACAAMDKVMAAAERAAQSDVPATITGEAGTGKQALARYIHRRSARGDKPFVVIDCGGVSQAFIESELFGHEKGAWEGAVAQKRGALEHAAGGTLFLSAVDQLPPPVQAKLLQGLQSGHFRRVGGEEEFAVDARIVAASREDLEARAREGLFREDLFYRLGVAKLRLPPLREREGDVLVLARHALRRACDAYNMNLATLTKAAEKALLKYRWPGNVRELENRLQRSVLNSSSRVIDAEALDLPRDAEEYGLKPLKSAREEAENRAVQLALSKAQGNLTLAASFLAIDRKVLRDVMERLGIQKEEFKPKMG